MNARKRPDMDAGAAVVAILRAISVQLADELVQSARPQRTDLVTCDACGCLCLPDERCPGCHAIRTDMVRRAIA